MRYRTYIESTNTVAGFKNHGTIYPQFSRLALTTLDEGENCNPTHIGKITIEDGRFSRASRRYGYTGQHTDVTPTGRHEIHRHPDGLIIDSDSPHLMVRIYSRNKYGGRVAYARLDCASRTLQRPIRRNGVTTWHRFEPTNYHD